MNMIMYHNQALTQQLSWGIIKFKFHTLRYDSNEKTEVEEKDTRRQTTRRRTAPHCGAHFGISRLPLYRLPKGPEARMRWGSDPTKRANQLHLLSEAIYAMRDHTLAADIKIWNQLDRIASKLLYFSIQCRNSATRVWRPRSINHMA